MSEGAKQVLDTVRVGAMATVNADNTPLATPLHFARFEDSIIWISDPDSRHASNVLRGSRVEFVVWNDSRQAVYLTTSASIIAVEKREEALKAYEKKLGKFIPSVDKWEVFVSPLGKIDEKSTTQHMWYFIA